MADAKSNRELSIETAEVLLNAIKEEAPGAFRRDTSSVESLARAYQLVHDTMPKSTGQGRSVQVR